MAPFAHPPERHFGYVCCKCQAASFLGRRYACWMCIDYQLCGNCYDAGELPLTPEHKYFHPLEVHYTRAEYELYFGGEGYAEANVPQSYKCALCNSCGFTSIQLYKHLSDVHRGHKDFDEYLSILYTRYTADASAARAPTSAPSPFLQIGSGIRLPSGTAIASPRSSTQSTLSFRDAVRLTQQRRNALLEQQAMNMLEELRASRSSARNANQSAIVLGGMEQGQQQRPIDGNVLYVRSTRNPKTGRARILPQVTRLGGGMPNSPAQMTRRSPEDNWVSYWASSRNAIEQQAMQLQRHRADRQLASYADVARQSAGNTSCKDNGKTDSAEPELNKFLCAQFMPKEKEKQHQSPMASNRSHFIEAILCSMLSEEQLSPTPLEAVVILVEPKPVDEAYQLQCETTTVSSNPDDVMDRFYRGLDNYNNWLAEFTKAKSSNDAEISAVPNMIFQATQEPILGIDSDVDNDTDEREEEDDNGEGSESTSRTERTDQVYKLLTIDSIDVSEQEVDESIEIEPIDVNEDEEDVEDEDGDEDDDDSEGSSGSETSDSTIAMMVNEIDQVYGS